MAASSRRSRGTNPRSIQTTDALESVTVNPDASFDFWHADDDMIGVHTILVRCNLTNGPTDAWIDG
jgi:hypothetical protein